LPKRERERKCLVLDLDETLVHSSFKVSRRRRKHGPMASRKGEKRIEVQI